MDDDDFVRRRRVTRQRRSLLDKSTGVVVAAGGTAVAAGGAAGPGAAGQKRKVEEECGEPSKCSPAGKKRPQSEGSLLLAEDESFFNKNASELMAMENSLLSSGSKGVIPVHESEDMFANSDEETGVTAPPAHPNESTPRLRKTPSRTRRVSTATAASPIGKENYGYSTRRRSRVECAGAADKVNNDKSLPLGETTPHSTRKSLSRQQSKLSATPSNTSQTDRSVSLTPCGTPSQHKSASITQASTNSESQGLCSMPLSLLNVRERVLQSTPKQTQPNRLLQQNKDDSYVNEHVVNVKKDRGPFYGLPLRVQQLYREKGIKELFPWQIQCLTSKAVQNKNNLLYSLPTSGGKTLVAEIIMLQEMLCYRKNCIFVLPYVSLVQEKIRSLSPFALDLGFYLEEYAGPKGRFPPQKRRVKKSLFICTIEKAHALLNSLVVEKRIHEVGLVVIDEVHMIGENNGRGANLESFITKIKYINSEAKEQTVGKGRAGSYHEKPSEMIQIISMSATVGNLKELSIFLESELYTDSWRPVQLYEYIKVGQDIHKVQINEAEQFQFVRKLSIANCTQDVKSRDGDFVTNLILEVYPAHSCLVFCDTKRRCENVSLMICEVLHMLGNTERIGGHCSEEKEVLIESLKQEGSGFMCPKLEKTLRYGVAYHHSGLTMDERKLIEEGYLNGTIGVLCCTSTLAAGVNLPARRVIIRSPFMGRSQLTHTQYKQMTGRAGRAGLDTHGEAFLMVKPHEVKRVESVVTSPVEHCMTTLHLQGNTGLATLILNSLFLGIISTPAQAKAILEMTLMNLQSKKLSVDTGAALQTALDLLLENKLISLADSGGWTQEATQQTCHLTTPMKPTRLGRAAIQGNVPLNLAGRLYKDLKNARPHLAVDTPLHLLYLVTPYDLTETIYYTASIYYKIFMKLDESELQVARVLGIHEGVITALMTCGQVSKAVKPALARFYLTLVLLDLWNGVPIHEVANKFDVSRGEAQNLMTSAASFASSVLHFCDEIEEFWAYQELLEPFVKRLAHCCTPDLLPLLELPGVKAGRARQLLAAGYSTIQAISRSDPKDLVARVEHLPFKTAKAIVQSAQLLLIDKAEALHDEAEILLNPM